MYSFLECLCLAVVYCIILIFKVNSGFCLSVNKHYRKSNIKVNYDDCRQEVVMNLWSISYAVFKKKSRVYEFNTRFTSEPPAVRSPPNLLINGVIKAAHLLSEVTHHLFSLRPSATVIITPLSLFTWPRVNLVLNRDTRIIHEITDPQINSDTDQKHNEQHQLLFHCDFYCFATNLAE